MNMPQPSSSPTRQTNGLIPPAGSPGTGLPADGPGLTLTDIIRLLDRDGHQEKRTRSVLSRYLADPETAALMGASGPVRPTFPQGAVAVMNAILEASERGEVTPAKGSAWLAKHFPDTGKNEAVPVIPKNRETEIARTDSLGGNPGTEFLLAVQTLVERIPVRDDRLLTSTQAAELLACRPRSVTRYVKAVRPGIFRWSDIMLHIESLRQRAESG